MQRLGIDIGGTMTKIVVSDGERILKKALLPSASLTKDELTKTLHSIGAEITQIEKITATGVGAERFGAIISEYARVSEFEAAAAGALKLSGLSEALIVSMGTGSAFVLAKGGQSVHIGGSGVGGGTLLGLSRALLGVDTPQGFDELTLSGNLRNVDLCVGDMSSEQISMLFSDVTSANFGKVEAYADKSDYAIGLLNMVSQTIGMLAVFALRSETLRDVLLIGGLTEYTRCRECFELFHKLFDVRFHVVSGGIFAGAYGAALQ